MLPAHIVVLLLAAGSPQAPVAPPREASAAIREAAARLLGMIAADEPDVVAVQQAAEARAAPSREDAEGWRSRARLAGFLPRLVAEYRHDERSLRASGISSGQELDYVRLMPGDTILVRVAWDLDQLIFGRGELNAAAALETAANRRREAADRATRLYFERLRLRLALVATPPVAPEARAQAELELASVTAQLHALTGLYREGLR